MSRRLLHANLKNDVPAIDEVHRLLADLREAWVAIGDKVGQPAAAAPAMAHTAAFAGA
jgi:flagellar protein FliS